MSKYNFLKNGSNGNSHFANIYFNFFEVPFAMIHFKKNDNSEKQVKVWYGVGSNPLNIDFRFAGDLFLMHSSQRVVYAYNSNKNNENIVMTNPYYVNDELVSINLKYYIPWWHANSDIKEEMHTILIGAQIREWHTSIREGRDVTYCFGKLVTTKMLDKIESLFPEDLRIKIDTTYAQF